MAAWTGTLGSKVHQTTSWTIQSVRARGVFTTSKIIATTVEDAFFDWRFGTETKGTVYSDQFEQNIANREHSVRHSATKVRPFTALLRHLRLPQGTTFVDVGSGKGKVLLLAAQHSFKRVVGIDLSPSLCEQALRNIEIFCRKVERLAPIEVHQTDATNYVFQGDENVFFLYNPFDGLILHQFIENLRRSLIAHRRQVWLIYCTPLHASVIEASELFTARKAFSLSGKEFFVYHTAERNPDF